MDFKPTLFFIFLLSFFNGFCNDIEKSATQNSDKGKRQITFTELINEMVNCKNSVYVLENADIISDRSEAESSVHLII